nr:phage tail tape measure protein [uncultured Oscillibacter sp.]
MASNKTLDLTIRIAGKMDKSLLAAINGTQSHVSDLARTVSRVGTAGLAAMSALATGTVAALAQCTDAAKDFESQMSNVVKYVGGLADANGKISDSLADNGKTYAQNYAEMTDAILNLSTQIPMTAEELTQLAAAAGQSGKTISDLIQYDDKGNITGFLKDVAMMGTAMDISAEQAGDWAAKWEHSFNLNHDQVMVLSDQINYLGANSATTAAEIAQVVNDAAGLGQIAGMDVASTAALADAMLAMGVEGSKAATGISRIYTNMSLGASATKAQREMWQSLGYTAEGVAKAMQVDATGTMIDVFEAIGNMDADKQVAALKTLFGQWAIQGAAKLTGNLGSFTDALAMVNDPSLYSGSMEREFIIKSSNSEAIDMMMANAFQALKIDVGTAFLPAKKEMSVALIDFINQLRNMPELGEVAQTLASLFSQGVTWAGEALEKALPTIQQALNYLLDHGPQVVSVLKSLAGAFLAMKFAPGITGLLGGAGNLLLGAKSGMGNYATRTGGLAGMLSGLWNGGRNAAGQAGGLISAFGGAAQGNGFLRTLSATASSLLSGNGIAGTTGLLTAGAGIPGLLSGFQGVGGVIKNSIAGSGIGQYFGGIMSSLGNLGNTAIGSGILGGLKATGGTIGEILSGISDATGLTGLVNGGVGMVRNGAGWVAGKAGGLAQGAMGLAGRVASSGPGQMIEGALGNVGSFMSAGMGALGSMWGPMASGFGGLLSGALPIVGVISSIIAVVSILGDHLEDIRGIVGNVFGDAGLAVFDTFLGGLQRVSDFITGLFQDGGVAQAMAPLRDAITGMFGDDAGAAFDGLVQILQSVMGVVGQVVTFANTTVKPIIQEIFSFITQTVVPIIVQTFTAAAPAISGIISGLGSAVMSCMQIIGMAIQTALPIIEGVISVVLSIASVVIPALLAGYEAFSSGLATIVSAIQTVFQGIIDFVTGVFTLNWQQAWQGVQDIFGGIFEGLGALIKTPLNAVISIINKAISGINGLGLTIPDWVPVIGGKSFSINIPEIPMLAKGGFTNGPSIAGEAGTEAVISFQKSARSQNIDTWMQAGKMLGVGNQPAELLDLPAGAGRNPGFSVTFAPHVEIKGNADKNVVDQALEESEQRFEAWLEANFERLYDRMERERGRRAYV